MAMRSSWTYSEKAICERRIAMSEKRGYPNPNYTEEDVMTEEEAILEEVGRSAA